MLRFLSLAGTYDKLHLSSLAVIEVIARRVDVIEYQYRERCGEESDLFDGVGKTAGGACVAPAIVEFVASELKKMAKIDKQSGQRRWEDASFKVGADH